MDLDLTRPRITVSGFCSGVGKTTVVECLLRALAGAASALKVTVVDSGHTHCPIGKACGVCAGLRTPYELIADPRRLAMPRKDTGRYAAAGARRVVWVKTHATHLVEAVSAGLLLLGAGPVVCEGNTPVPCLDPELAVLVDRSGPRRETKPSARRLLDRIQLAILNHPADQGNAGLEQARRRLARDLPGVPVVEMDARLLSPVDCRRALAAHIDLGAMSRIAAGARSSTTMPVTGSPC